MCDYLDCKVDMVVHEIDKHTDSIPVCVTGIKRSDQWKYRNYHGGNGTYVIGGEYLGVSLDYRFSIDSIKLMMVLPNGCGCFIGIGGAFTVDAASAIRKELDWKKFSAARMNNLNKVIGLRYTSTVYLKNSSLHIDRSGKYIVADGEWEIPVLSDACKTYSVRVPFSGEWFKII